MQAERRDLLRQSLGDRLERKFGRAVVDIWWVRDQPGHRRHIDDMPATTRPHPGQDGLDRVDHTEIIGVEEPPDLLVLALLQRGHIPVPCVIDQNIHPAESVFGCCDRRGNLGAVGDVQRQRQGAVTMRPNQVSDLFGLSCRDHHAVALVEGKRGDLAADSGRASGDQPDSIR